MNSLLCGKNKLTSSYENAYWSPFNADGSTGIGSDFSFSSSVKMDPTRAFTQMKSGNINSDDTDEHKFEDVYTFKDIKGAYNAAKDNDYVVEMDVNLSWTKGDGATVPLSSIFLVLQYSR